jgi:hypothetical protein
MEGPEVLQKWLEANLGLDDEIDYIVLDERLLGLRFHQHLFGINIYFKDAKITIEMPDSIAHLCKEKRKDFDLCNPDSLAGVKKFINDGIYMFYNSKVIDDPEFTIRDRDVIVDAFTERLPIVWSDALLAIENGEDPEAVVDEMVDGHVLRILRKLNYDIKPFVENFRTFAIVNGDHNMSSDGD